MTELHGNLRVMVHPLLKQRHREFVQGVIGSREWCAVFQHMVYKHEIPSDLVHLLKT